MGADYISKEQSELYAQNGYLHVNGLLSRDDAARYRQELRELAERLGERDATWSSIRSADPGKRMRLMHCHDVQFHSAAFSRLIVHGSGVNRSNEPRTTILIQMRDPTDRPLVEKHTSRGQGMMLAGVDPRKPESEFAWAAKVS